MSLTTVSQIGARARGVPKGDHAKLKLAINAYLQQWTRDWLAEKPGRTAVELAGHVGLTDAQVTTLKVHGRGAGDLTVRGYAKYMNVSRDELEARALAAYEAREPPSKPDIRIEYDERYPNKRKALVGLQAAGVELREKTERSIDTRIYHSKVDPPPEHWIKEILALDEKVRWEEANPAEAEAQREREKARLEQLLAEETAKSQAAVDKIPGLRGPKDLPPAPPKLGTKQSEK